MMLAPIVALTLLAAAPRPLEVVRSGYENVQETARTPGATLEQLAIAVDRFFDFEELARRAMGESWSSLSAAQRRELAADMRGMLRAFYARKALGHGDAQVEYGQETLRGNEATVSTVVSAEGVRLLIDYKLYRPAQQASGWRIYDMVTNQDSLLESYRSQFRQILETEGFSSLLATVKDRREQIEGPAPQRPREPGRARPKKAPVRQKPRSGK